MINNKSINGVEYKELVFPLENPVKSVEITDLITTINNFQRSILRASYNDESHSIDVLINSVDLIEFTTAITGAKNTSVMILLKQISDRISAIGSYGLKDGKRVFIGFNKERKVQNRKKKEAERSKYYYALDNDFSHENNEIPDQYVNKIVCGDSQLILKDLPDNCIDLMFTSPPYNFGLEYDNQKDEHFWDDYFSKLFLIFDEVIRVLKYGGRFIINLQPLYSDYIPTHHIISIYIMDNKLIWITAILWEKNNYNCKYTSWGSYKSPSSPYFKYTWEFLEVFMKGTLIKKGSNSDIDITADEFKEWVFAKWSIGPERNMKKYGHPAMFPEELARRAIKLFSYQGDIVLDPFMGVGTTPLVAKKHQRRYLGIDISEEYCSVAQDRINEMLL